MRRPLAPPPEAEVVPRPPARRVRFFVAAIALPLFVSFDAPAAASDFYDTPDVTLPRPASSPATAVVTASNGRVGRPVVLRRKPQVGGTALFAVAAAGVSVTVAEAAGPNDPLTPVQIAAVRASPSAMTYLTWAGRGRRREPPGCHGGPLGVRSAGRPPGRTGHLGRPEGRPLVFTGE
jgi:hypothetical protein